MSKRGSIKRDWSLANEEKRSDVCRACGRRGLIELAHISGREHDFKPALGYEEIPILRDPLFVAPTRVIPLCGPSTDTGTCHNLHHSHKLDLIGKLTAIEFAQSVLDFAPAPDSTEGPYAAWRAAGGFQPASTKEDG